MKRIYETVYPDDSVGYQCYSIQLWEDHLERVRDWGTLRIYILETRFIWKGVLLFHQLEVQEHNLDELLEEIKITDRNWKGLIDELIKGEKDAR